MSGRTAIVTLLAAACLVALSLSAPAATYLVRASGSGGDFATIQEAVNAVVDTDIIELDDGTFDGVGNYDIDFLGKAITIRSLSGDPTDVTIDCGGTQFDSRRAFWFHNSEGSGSVLQNITVVNGYITDGKGGGILCEGAAPTIEGCVFGSNTVTGTGADGGAIYMDSPPYFVMSGCRFIGNTAGEFTSGKGGAVAVVGAEQGEFQDCVFGAGNYAGGSGGGVYLSNAPDGDVLLEGCTVTDNAAPAGAGVYCDSGIVAMDGCSVYWNEAGTTPAIAGGLFVGDSANIVRSTFMGNLAGTGGGIYFSDSGDGDVANCIVAYSLMGGGIHVETPTRVTPVCCDVYENTGGNYTGALSDQTGMNNNISEEPQFCGAASGDLTLYNTSPCAAEYSPCGQIIGANGVDCLSPVEPSSWGKIKSDYK